MTDLFFVPGPKEKPPRGPRIPTHVAYDFHPFDLADAERDSARLQDGQEGLTVMYRDLDLRLNDVNRGIAGVDTRLTFIEKKMNASKVPK
ncbi:MAG: hypothetical protein WCB19_02280 [Thermoplasmata archaeon]